MTVAGIITIIWSSAGALATVVLAIGIAVKWTCHDSYDVQLEEARGNKEVRIERLKNEHLKLEMEREKRLLT